MGMTVGRMRHRHGVKAPAMTGHEQFERALRVQMNTRRMGDHLPADAVDRRVWFGGWIPPVAGFVWVVGRVTYMIGYIAAPEKRGTGFMIQAGAALVLLVAAIAGLVHTFLIT